MAADYPTYDLSFRIENRLNGSQWSIFALERHVEDDQLFKYTVNGVDEYTTYEFRVVIRTDDDGEAEDGLPSPVSDPVKPVCPGK